MGKVSSKCQTMIYRIRMITMISTGKEYTHE